MDVYYHVKFQLCITSGSKVNRGVQNCTTHRNRMCSDPPGIGLTFTKFPKKCGRYQPNIEVHYHV